MPESPIVVDAFGEGFHLTDVKHGVLFGFFPNNPKTQTSWTDAAFSNGFLALDRDGDGRVDNGTELFGNITPQPPSPTPNGFLALAVFDLPSNGGNGNGSIDPGDSVYAHLLIWIDANHNGISEPNELHTLPELGIFKIDLHYSRSDYVDAFGNHFRYRSKIWDEAANGNHVCYDVFLQLAGGGN